MDEIEINGIRIAIPADDEPFPEEPVVDEEIITTEEYGDLLVRPVD